MKTYWTIKSKWGSTVFYKHYLNAKNAYLERIDDFDKPIRNVVMNYKYYELEKLEAFEDETKSRI